MKTFALFTQFLLIVSALLLSNAKNPVSNYIQDLKDNKRDIENYLSVENIERDIKFNGQRALDVYYDKQNTSELKPVYIFIYGGSWHSGSKVKFTNFGSLLQNNGYVAVLPNYVLFPYGGFEDMVDDIYKAIKWTFENIKQYGGDPDRVSIAAYSAGSHLTALTLVKSILQYTNKNQFLEPFPTLEKAVLLNGPYDFDDYSQTVKFIASDENSLVEQLAKRVFKTPNVSPTDLLKPVADNSLTTLGAKKFIFFYTSLDTQVRETSAANFMAQMRRVCPNVEIEYIYKEGFEHSTLTRGVRAGEKDYEDLFITLAQM